MGREPNFIVMTGLLVTATFTLIRFASPALALAGEEPHDVEVDQCIETVAKQAVELGAADGDSQGPAATSAAEVCAGVCRLSPDYHPGTMPRTPENKKVCCDTGWNGTGGAGGISIPNSPNDWRLKANCAQEILEDFNLNQVLCVGSCPGTIKDCLPVDLTNQSDPKDGIEFEMEQGRDGLWRYCYYIRDNSLTPQFKTGGCQCYQRTTI